MNSKHPNKSQDGFTLIEVVIVLVILTFISIGIYQMMTSTYRLRDSLANEGEFYNSIRMSMDVVERDVASMYSPIMVSPQASPSPNPANPNALPTPASPDDLKVINSDLGKTSDFWLGATDKTGLRLSRFQGTDTKMSFIIDSHVRIYKDTPESDFATVSYELVRDSENKEIPDSMALLRIENSDAFDDDSRHAEKYAHRYLILHGIKKLKFRYWQKSADNGLGRWETSWDTDKEDFKNQYPDIVEINLDVNGPDQLSFSGIYKFRPEVPLRATDPSY